MIDLSKCQAVTPAKFMQAIGGQDVHPSILPGAYPYSCEWLTRTRVVKGYTVSNRVNGKVIDQFYLLKSKP